jgi:hypothetical protein
LKFVKDLISRIRWNVVISVAALIVFAVIALFFIKPFNPQYTCSDEVCISTRMEPDAVGLKGESILWVDLKNDGSEDIMVDVTAKTRNLAILFKKNMSRNTSRLVQLGAGESMKLNFNVKANATYPGTYIVDVLVKYNREEIKSDTRIRVG